MPSSSPTSQSPTLGGKVQFVGQTIALVVALSQEQARAAARFMMDPSSEAIAHLTAGNTIPQSTMRLLLELYHGDHTVIEHLQPGVKSIDDAVNATTHVHAFTLMGSGISHGNQRRRISYRG